MRVRPISNTVQLNSAKNVFLATSVLVVNTGSTDRTLTISNTASIINGGGDYGGASQAQVFLNAGEMIIIEKQPTDTINAGNTDTVGTKVAKGSG